MIIMLRANHVAFSQGALIGPDSLRTTCSSAYEVVLGMQVFIISSKKIQDKNYETLFKWITTRNAGNIIGRIVLSVPPPWQVKRGVVHCTALSLYPCNLPVTWTERCSCTLLQPLAYMCVHISLTTMTFMLCKLWW